MTNSNATDEINQRFAMLIQRIDPAAHLRRRWRLAGGVSAEITALEIEQPDGGIEKLVVRLHGETDRSQNPNIAKDEFAVLQTLHTSGLPVPAPRYVDAVGEFFGVPCLIIDFVEESTDFAAIAPASVAAEMAMWLARIHAIDHASLGLDFLPDQAVRCSQRLAVPPTRLDVELDERRIRQTLTDVWPLPSHNRSTLLHGDFWPGNMLWQDGRLTSIIDWEDAAVGDPLADLANSRLELMMLLGTDIMNDFTSRYLEANPTDIADLPYWELCAALRPITGMADWDLDEAALQQMRSGLKTFIHCAFERLSRR